MQSDGGRVIGAAFRHHKQMRPEPIQLRSQSRLVASLKGDQAKEGGDGDSDANGGDDVSKAASREVSE